jgi:broad specificity phosphatase PhoE
MLLPPDERLIHFVRHAQGFHNVDPRPIHERDPDAHLTPEGEAQCAALAAEVAQLTPELIVVSPLTRTLQTATLVFDAHLRGPSPPPLIACEHARETVNYLCDCRR